MSDKEIILAVEVVRVLLDAAFTYAQTKNIAKEKVEEVFLETYSKIEELDPKNLPEVD